MNGVQAPWRDVLARGLGAALGLGLAANGLAMLTGPDTWYQAIATVKLTGPLNTHFVRDIGCAYLTASAGLLWGAWRSQGRQMVWALAAMFLMLHALVHLYEVATGICGWNTWLRDVPGVTLPALLAALLAALPAPAQSSPAPLPTYTTRKF